MWVNPCAREGYTWVNLCAREGYTWVNPCAREGYTWVNPCAREGYTWVNCKIIHDVKKSKISNQRKTSMFIFINGTYKHT